MTNKRFTNIEHDYENAWIKCKDNGDFMIYAIYKELDESLPSLEDLLNGLSEENEQLKKLCSILKEKIQFYEDQVVNPECPICHTILQEISIDPKKDRYYRKCPKCGYEREESLI